MEQSPEVVHLPALLKLSELGDVLRRAEIHGRPHLSRESVEKALRDTMKLADKHSPHGWRSAFSTRAREDTEFDAELVDLSLDEALDFDKP